MAVGKYGNTLGSPSLGNNTYPDTTAKAVRLLTLPLSQMDWLYYGGQFGTSNIDLNGSTSITLTCPDLKIAKTGSAASVPAGTDYTYTLTVTNTTSYIEPSATVTDTLPAGLTFVSADNSGTYDSTTHKVIWNLGAIAASGTKVVTVTVTAPNVATVMAGTTNVTNTASVTGAGDNNSANDTGNATTTFLLADLGIAKSGPPSVLAGNNYTYTLTVSNTTALPSTSAVATDTLPTGLTFVSASNSGTYDSTTRKVTWNLGTVVANSVTAVTVTVTAPSAAAVEAGTISVTNTARVSSTGDNNSANDTANATTAIGLATLTKTVRNVTRNTAAGLTANGGPNDVLEYCLNYINKGGADLLNFVLTDSVPANLDAITSNTGTGNNVSSTGYDTAANGAGFAGSGYGIQWIKAATSYLTSPSDTDSGSLTSTGGTYNKGLLTLNVGTLAAGASGTACFRASIH